MLRLSQRRSTPHLHLIFGREGEEELLSHENNGCPHGPELRGLTFTAMAMEAIPVSPTMAKEVVLSLYVSTHLCVWATDTSLQSTPAPEQPEELTVLVLDVWGPGSGGPCQCFYIYIKKKMCPSTLNLFFQSSFTIIKQRVEIVGNTIKNNIYIYIYIYIYKKIQT